jgi:hypothetical protein
VTTPYRTKKSPRPRGPGCALVGKFYCLKNRHGRQVVTSLGAEKLPEPTL